MALHKRSFLDTASSCAIAALCGYAVLLMGTAMFYIAKELGIALGRIADIGLSHPGKCGLILGLATFIAGLVNARLGLALGASMVWSYCAVISLTLCLGAVSLHSDSPRIEFGQWFSAFGYMAPVTAASCISLWIRAFRVSPPG